MPDLPERYRDAEYVFLGNIDPAMQMEVLNQIRRMKLVVCDTMDHWINTERAALRYDGLSRQIRMADVIDQAVTDRERPLRADVVVPSGRRTVTIALH